jgi:hypothetical protein
MLSTVWQHLSDNVEEKSPTLAALEVSFRKLPASPSSVANQCCDCLLHRPQFDDESSVALVVCSSDPGIPIFQPYVTISPPFPVLFPEWKIYSSLSQTHPSSIPSTLPASDTFWANLGTSAIIFGERRFSPEQRRSPLVQNRQQRRFPIAPSCAYFTLAEYERSLGQ